jgi:plasmid stabilization system protein ParE
MKLTLFVTEPAEQDFRDIVSYTSQTWGDTQSVKYGQKIYAAFDKIIKNPNIGK